MFTVDVVLYNEHGMELSREPCKDMAEATSAAIAICRRDTVETGDSIKFERRD